MFTKVFRKQEYEIYESELEFREYNPDVKLVMKWREGNTGDWVLADDGCVCKLVKRSVWNGIHGAKTVYQTPIGLFQGGPCAYMDCNPDLHYNPRSFSSRKDNMDGNPGKKECSRWEIAMATLVAEGVEPVDAFRQIRKRAKNIRYLTKTAYNLVNTERMKAMIKTKVREAAGKLHMDEEWVMQKLKDTVETHIGSEDPKNVALGLDALKEVKDCLDMEPSKESHFKFGRGLRASTGEVSEVEFAEVNSEVDNGRGRQLSSDVVQALDIAGD